MNGNIFSEEWQQCGSPTAEDAQYYNANIQKCQKLRSVFLLESFAVKSVSIPPEGQVSKSNVRSMTHVWP